MALGQPDPATGKVKSPFNEGPGEVWSAPAGASFGNFESADLQQFIDVQKSLDTKISNVARIPAHWLNMGQGEFPSGEALKTADSPFVAKIDDRQTEEGQFHSDIARFALKSMTTTGVVVKCNWKTSELRSEKEMLDAAEQKLRIGWSKEAVMKEFGLTESQITEMLQQKQDAMLEEQKNLSQGIGVGIPSGGGNKAPATAVVTKLPAIKPKVAATQA